MRLSPIIFIAAFCLVSVCTAQLPASPAPPPDTAEPQIHDRQHIPDPAEVEQQKKMEKARNEQRQKELKRDTDRLLELATELKQYVDRTNDSVLSMDVIHKSEEIEKLAKSIKNKMKGP